MVKKISKLLVAILLFVFAVVYWPVVHRTSQVQYTEKDVSGANEIPGVFKLFEVAQLEPSALAWEHGDNLSFEANDGNWVIDGRGIIKSFEFDTKMKVIDVEFQEKFTLHAISSSAKRGTLREIFSEASSLKIIFSNSEEGKFQVVEMLFTGNGGHFGKTKVRSSLHGDSMIDAEADIVVVNFLDKKFNFRFRGQYIPEPQRVPRANN